MKLRTLAIVLALCMVMGLTVCAAGTDNAGDTDVYKQMKQVYTQAGAGQGADGFYYILAYDENVENAIFILMDEKGESSINVVGPVTQEESWLTITDTKNNNTITFGIKDPTDTGFTMVMQKNEEEIPMEFCDAAKAVDIIAAIDQNTKIVNPFAEEEQK